MKKLENFSNCLEVLKSADFEMADNNDIYRTGVIGQFNLTFELAWKALQIFLSYFLVQFVLLRFKGFISTVTPAPYLTKTGGFVLLSSPPGSHASAHQK